MSVPKFVVFSLFTGLLVCIFLHPIYALNEDLGRHLALGKIIIQTGHIPLTNLFSYTYPLFPFINTHWFSEVVFFLLFSIAGFSGLLFFTTALALVTFGITFWSSAKKASFISLGIACLFAVGIIFNRTDIRPELFSFFFLSLFIAILSANREKITKWIYLLPFITLFWVNMHIYFLIGPVVMAFFLIDKITLDILGKKNVSQQFKSWYLPFGMSFILTLLTTLLNPHGVTGALYPFFVFNNYGYTIVENQSIFFLQSILNIPSISFFEVNILLLGLLLLTFWKKSRPIDWMLSLFFAYIGITALRNTPLFLFATFGIFVRNSDFLGQSLGEIPLVKKNKKNWLYWQDFVLQFGFYGKELFLFLSEQLA